MPDRWIDDHIGHEVTPRPGFEAELETTLLSAWSTKPGTEPVRRVPVGGGRSGRPRRLLVAALGAAAALVAAVLTLAIARDGDSSNMPADPTAMTGPPVPTSVPTTDMAPSPTAASTLPPISASTAPVVVSAPATAAPPITQAVVPDASGPPASDTGAPPEQVSGCVELPATSGASPPSDPHLSVPFGPLASEPALAINLVTRSNAVATAIPGGVLIRILAGGDTPGRSLVAAVNTDGAVRWTRCLDESDGAWVLRSDVTVLGDTYVPIARHAATEAVISPDWQLLSLADGSTTTSLADEILGHNPGLADISGHDIIASDEARFLLGARSSTGAAEDLLVLDRDTLNASEVPFPSAAQRADGSFAPVALDDTGQPAVIGAGPGEPPLLAVYRNGTWTTDPTQVATGWYGVDFRGDGLRAVDGAGAVRWTNPDVQQAFFVEGFSTALSGEVTVAAACVPTVSEPLDCEPAVVGVGTFDGTIRWTLPGQQMVSVVADGYALLRDTAGSGTSTWRMIDTSTGEPVAGQRWDDPLAFLNLCCDDGEFVRAYRTGGVVVAVSQGRVTVWYPADAGLPPATATLP